MIFFRDVCLIPIMPPIIAFNDEIRHIMCLCFVLGRIMYVVINNGASFCQVDRRRQFIHLAISIVKGYQ